MSRVKNRLILQLKLISDYMSELKRGESYRGIERLVQLIIQSILDLGLMILSIVGCETDIVYKDIGRKLRERGFIDKEDESFLIDAAGMRNVLVHGYFRIDRDIILNTARRELPEFVPRFIEKIKPKIDSLSVDPSMESREYAALRSIFRRNGVKLAFLFGGRALGYKIRGDYDFAIYYGRKYSFRDVGRIAVEISDKMNVPLEKIDILVLDNADPETALKAAMGIPIYWDDEYELFEYRYRCLREALDLRVSRSLINT